MEHNTFKAGSIYRLFTQACPEGFIFQPLSIGSKGMTGYMDESASWPRNVSFAEIAKSEENPSRSIVPGYECNCDVSSPDILQCPVHGPRE
jgi:hypothetical protein